MQLCDFGFALRCAERRYNPNPNPNRTRTRTRTRTLAQAEEEIPSYHPFSSYPPSLALAQAEEEIPSDHPFPSYPPTVAQAEERRQEKLRQKEAELAERKVGRSSLGQG